MIRDVTITTVLNGWIVTVGCQRVVFNNKGKMLDEISDYLLNPKAMEGKYQRTAINAKLAFRDAEAVSNEEREMRESD